MSDIPVRLTDDRFQLILENLPLRTGSVLDIGTYYGDFCHRFEEAGFDCVGVERSEKHLYFLALIRDALERRFEIVSGSVFDMQQSEFDVVLALNIFHHFLKEERNFERLKSYLNRLTTSYLFLETHRPDDPQMIRAYRKFEPTEFANWVAREAGLSDIRLIGEVESGRQIFRLAR